VALGALDRMDDRPPYRQIADQLRAAIERGELQPGDRLPSEAALMEHYHVARMTARQAIQELRSEGRVLSPTSRGRRIVSCALSTASGGGTGVSAKLSGRIFGYASARGHAGPSATVKPQG
jgi:DNA-binding GntR family transcriptional regulator